MAYLLIMALGLGLGLVYLQTARYQAMARLIGLGEQEHQIRQQVRVQQVVLSRRMENPEQMREMLARWQIPVLAPSQEIENKEGGFDLAKTE